MTSFKLSADDESKERIKHLLKEYDVLDLTEFTPGNKTTFFVRRQNEDKWVKMDVKDALVEYDECILKQATDEVCSQVIPNRVMKLAENPGDANILVFTLKGCGACIDLCNKLSNLKLDNLVYTVDATTVDYPKLTKKKGVMRFPAMYIRTSEKNWTEIDTKEFFTKILAMIISNIASENWNDAVKSALSVNRKP